MAGKQRPSKIPVHRVFLGRHAEGTLCAELYGQLLKELGLLSHGGVICKAAQGLIAHTQQETKAGTTALVESCKGKVRQHNNAMKQFASCAHEFDL
jgi:hypothetical protein